MARSRRRRRTEATRVMPSATTAPAASPAPRTAGMVSMEPELTIASGRNTAVAPLAGWSESARLILRVTAARDRRAAGESPPLVRTKNTWGPGIELPCVLRIAGGMSWSSMRAPVPMPGPMMAGIVATPATTRRVMRPCPVPTSTLAPRWVCRAAIVLAPSTIWSAARRSLPSTPAAARRPRGACRSPGGRCGRRCRPRRNRPRRTG